MRPALLLMIASVLLAAPASPRADTADDTQSAPDGQGFREKAAIAGFWDQVIGPANTTSHSQLHIPSGPTSCHCHVTAANQIGVQALSIEMVVTCHLNAAGEIAALRAYWDVEAIMRAFTGATQ